MKVEYINPFLTSAADVFATMLNCEITRGQISLNADFRPEHDVSGIIGLSGKATGTVVVSLARNVALSAAEVFLGERPDDINDDVVDTVGELTNIIAGRAKALLEHLSMSLSLPTVITGKGHTVKFGSSTSTICIPFTCKWGDLTVEVGLVEEKPEATLTRHAVTANSC